jgi:hypothetical protein
MRETSKKWVRKRLSIICFVLGILPISAIAQNYFLPVNNTSLIRLERAGVHRQNGVHFGLKPTLSLAANVEDVAGLGRDTAKYYYRILDKVFSEHLIELRKPGFQLNADFIFDFGYGQEIEGFNDENQSLFQNTRGFAISAQIGDRVYLYTDFRENQARFPDYVDGFVDSLSVVPGNGRIKPFKEDGFDYNMANGYVGIDAADWLSLSFGHFKHFIGHGHRSLLLSDNAFNYPFASYKLSFFENKLQYTYNISILQSLDRLPQGDTPESLFQRKMMAFNYLSFKPNQSLEIGLFESLIWKRYDDSTGTVPFNYAALNPIPLLNTAIYGLQDQDHNSVVGLNIGWHPTRMLSIYGQYMLDDLDVFRAGYQLGAKYRGIWDRVDLQFEFNSVSSNSYANRNPLQSYTHTNQPLAHPLGAGFEEYVATITYLHGRWYGQFKMIAAQLNSTGRDPLSSDLEEITYESNDVSFQDIRIAYIFNPTTNMQVYAGFTNRFESKLSGDVSNQFWYFGIRTNLANMYTDF